MWRLLSGVQGDVAFPVNALAKHQPHPEGNLPQAAVDDHQLRVRGRDRNRQQFRIPLWILRIAMMIPVEQAVVFVRQADCERGEMTEGEIKCAATKRRLMGGLVYHHEQECDKVALDDDQRQRPDYSVSQTRPARSARRQRQ